MINPMFSIRRFAVGLSILLGIGLNPAGAQEVLVDPDPKGYASGIYGRVMILEPESESPKPLSDSDPVFEGSRITASEDAFAEIHLLDGSEIKVDELTQVDLSKISANLEELDRQIDFSMLYGSIRVSVQEGFSQRSVFKVTTPVAVAGVRGTDFAVEYESEDESHVDVFDGEVGVSQDGAEESVSAGESSRASRSGGIAKSSLQELRRDRWEHFDEAMTLHGREHAAEQLREKIERVRAANPNDPRLSGLETALDNVSKHREAARSKFEAAREKMKDSRSERLARMREFSKKHGREKFERARKFRGGAMTEDQRKAAAEKLRERRKHVRDRAGERGQERRRQLEERRREKLKDQKDRRQDNLQERRQNRREQMNDRRERQPDRREPRRERRQRR